MFLRWLFLLVSISVAPIVMGAADSVTDSSTRSGKNHNTNITMSDITGSPASSLTNSVHSDIKSSAASSAANELSSKSTATHEVLSPYAEEIAKILKFDRQVLVMIKEETHERIQRLVGYDEDGYQIVAPGIAVNVPEDKSDSILATLRRKLLPHKYMAFFIEMNAGLKADKIGIIKGTDQFEILRIMNTSGDDYDISNQDVIDRLEDWEKISAFEIIGADNDWVEIEFKRLPKNLKAFVKEVYEFSPDAVDEGPGTVEGLMKEIKKTRRLFLLWD
jgi:hypothetical protein